MSTSTGVNNSAAVTYYSRILEQVSPFSEFPISRLIGYRSQAPGTVKNVARNTSELISFLSLHSDMFTVNGGSVQLTRNFNTYELGMEKCEKKLLELKNDVSKLEAILFYAKTLEKCTLNYEASVEKLFIFRNNAPENVKMVAKTEEELLTLLCGYKDIFIVSDWNYVKLNKKSSTVNPVGDSSNSLAVKYYSNILSMYADEMPFPIYRLVGHRGQASPEVQNVAKNTSELREFLLCNPKHFVVTGDSVSLANVSVSKVTMSSNTNTNEAIDFYSNVLSRYGGYQCWVSIDSLIGHRSQSSPAVKAAAKNSSELENLLSSYPQVFIIENKHVCLTKYLGAGQSQKEESPCVTPRTYLKDLGVRQVQKEESPSVTPRTYLKDLGVRQIQKEESPSVTPRTYLKDLGVRQVQKEESPCVTPQEGRKNQIVVPILSHENRIVKHICVVENLEQCIESTPYILNENIIGVDFEGVNLGNGEITLIQIALCNGNVYLYDISKCARMAFCLQEIFESSSIIKVIHDCRNDAKNLRTQFGISLYEVFDTAIAFNAIVKGGKTLYQLPSLNEVCDYYKIPLNFKKDIIKDIMKVDPGFWLKRPLTDDMITYAAMDAALLVPWIYNKMTQNVDGDVENLILNLTDKVLTKFS